MARYEPFDDDDDGDDDDDECIIALHFTKKNPVVRLLCATGGNILLCWLQLAEFPRRMLTSS